MSEMNYTRFFGEGYREEFLYVETTEDGLFRAGQNGVDGIWVPRDKKVAFVEKEGQVLCRVSSLMGYPAYYPLREPKFTAPAKAVLMDLDGTSVHSEWFWMWIIEQTTARMLGKSDFKLEPEDEPFVSGHSVMEHLQYCLNKYDSSHSHTVDEARELYLEITRYEMAEIMAGRGKDGAFKPAHHLKEFLYALKDNGVKIGLVTSGLTEKAMPEIVSAFRTLDMGSPYDFYDAIISAGTAFGPGSVGTLSELEIKPHPWLYAETGRIGLGMDSEQGCVMALEDSSAGVVAARLAGYPCIGMEGGNIRQSGVTCLCADMCGDLLDVLPRILGDR
ncbi:MAG: HAD family phosphatase [Clostridia bacterium]|nr:HAD family phosphatase [Clostridia bacterium]